MKCLSRKYIEAISKAIYRENMKLIRLYKHTIGSYVWAFDVNAQPQRRSKRIRKTPERYTELVFIDGANNQHTVGRKVDMYDRYYRG